MTTEDPSPADADPSDGSTSEDREEFPRWLHRIVLLVLMICVVLLTISYLYPRFRSAPSSTKSELPSWKKKANEIINIAVRENRDRIPHLIELTRSNHRNIRQNAIWALHYLTGLPWGEKLEACRNWWKQYGDVRLKGEEPAEPPPSSDRFEKVMTPDEVNIDVFFNVKDPHRIVLSDEMELIHYEIGISNQNEDDSIEILPPDILPYRAYRYGPRFPEQIKNSFNVSGQFKRIPVHLQYGPSVAFLSLQWFDPMRDLDRSYRNEFLEFTVLGRGDSVLGPKKLKATGKSFPIRFDKDLSKAKGPQLVTLLSLDGRSLLLKYKGERVRVPFDTISHVLKVFKKNPDQVPGYGKQELRKIKQTASKNGYILERAERVRTGAYSKNNLPEQRAMESPHDRNEAIGGVQKKTPITGRRTYAAYHDDLPENTVLYDPKLGWGEIQASCEPCRSDFEANRKLSRIEAYLGSFKNSFVAGKAEKNHAGTRWVLFFKKKEK